MMPEYSLTASGKYWKLSGEKQKYRLMKRLFIAVDININEALVKLTGSYKSKLTNEKIRWADPAGMHLTLAFLGDMDERQEKMAAGIVSDTAASFEPFSISFTGTGLFRDLRRPRVIWLGIKADDTLFDLRDMLCRKLEKEGLYKDEKPFKPHLTLGRMKHIKDRELLSSLLSATTGHELPSQTVSEIVLYESLLKPGGPVYKKIRKGMLRQPAS